MKKLFVLWCLFVFGSFVFIYFDSLRLQKEMETTRLRMKSNHQKVLQLLARTNDYIFDEMFPDPDVITFADRPEPDPEYMRKFAGEIP